MSFRGGARGGGRGGGRGFSGGRGGGRGFGGRGGGRGGFDEGPPATVVELGVFLHACEDEMVYKSTSDKVPYFNAGAFLENKTKIGKVDEILGAINDVMFTVKPDAGVAPKSFKAGDKVALEVGVVLRAAVEVAAEAEVADAVPEDVAVAAASVADVAEASEVDVEAAASADVAVVAVDLAAVAAVDEVVDFRLSM
ncbi:hypothetical protein H257_09237 [Aphanomyces astaci]|uniref:H/ACA ribonucleoprotein complex subunit n=1 Tax=Aphanomyces astaci TaxID=112090 RepID=W4GCI6_APHAT|nr:hypothetical protein H257_09237 [Aphanomyces astaci]ETV76784.1 hypothetical protein H257_09237 [Aphanomyces astaci]|eukprot:XP_009833696.1 hypothetical protein H257_09237 [Aphanomyces astaci]